MSQVFRSGKRQQPKPLARPWHENIEAKAALAKASRLSRGNVRLAPSEAMFFGMHKGMSVERVCKLQPAYMHYLIRQGIVMATAPICALIQEGYDAEARELNAMHGSAKYRYTPITPQLAPTPTEE